MDINQNKNPLKTNASAGGSGDSGDKGFVVFGPIEIKRDSLIDDLSWLYSLSKAKDFDTAIALSWHKVDGREGKERMSRIVNFFRISQDGKSRPPFDFQAEYRKISGHELVPGMILEP